MSNLKKLPWPSFQFPIVTLPGESTHVLIGRQVHCIAVQAAS
ncbi:hypothetical protein [Streptomyces sp. NPDC088755]